MRRESAGVRREGCRDDAGQVSKLTQMFDFT